MYIKEKKGNNESVKKILNTYPPLFRTPYMKYVRGFFFVKQQKTKTAQGVQG